MSRDVFKEDFATSSLTRTQYGFAGGLDGAQSGGSSSRVPRDADMQRIADAIIAEQDAERARKEIEMDTPENRQKAAEAKVAERERKKYNFHFCRDIPFHMEEGWKHLLDESADEDIRVYTTDNDRLRFWGIKPAGMGVFDFWEQNDPEVSRWSDNYAMTWANPLVPPPVTTSHEKNPVIWAGRGLDPDVAPPELHVADAPPPAKAGAESSRRKKTPDINATHRVRKSTTKSPEAKKTTRKSLADKLDSGHPGLKDQVRDTVEKTLAGKRSTRKRTMAQRSDAQQKSTTDDEHSAASKRPKGRPAINARPAENVEISTPRRPRGRPAASTKSVTKDQDELPTKRPRGRPSASTRTITDNQDKLPPKRPRGRPPAKGKPPKQKRTPAVQGNARVTKPSQANRRPLAPSTHKMRTRGEGSAELLQLP